MQVHHGFQLTCDGVSVFSLWKIVGGEIINTLLASSVVLKGLYFYNARLLL